MSSSKMNSDMVKATLAFSNFHDSKHILYIPTFADHSEMSSSYVDYQKFKTTFLRVMNAVQFSCEQQAKVLPLFLGGFPLKIVEQTMAEDKIVAEIDRLFSVLDDQFLAISVDCNKLGYVRKMKQELLQGENESVSEYFAKILEIFKSSQLPKECTDSFVDHFLCSGLRESLMKSYLLEYRESVGGDYLSAYSFLRKVENVDAFLTPKSIETMNDDPKQTVSKKSRRRYRRGKRLATCAMDEEMQVSVDSTESVKKAELVDPEAVLYAVVDETQVPFEIVELTKSPEPISQEPSSFVEVLESARDVSPCVLESQVEEYEEFFDCYENIPIETPKAPENSSFSINQCLCQAFFLALLAVFLLVEFWFIHAKQAALSYARLFQPLNPKGRLIADPLWSERLSRCATSLRAVIEPMRRRKGRTNID